MEEILGALALALSEEGFTIAQKHVGKHSYLLVGHEEAEETALVTVGDGHTSDPSILHFVVPLADPDSIERLVDHLNHALVPATV